MSSSTIPARQLYFWFRRIVFAIIMLAFILAVAGFTYQSISQYRDRRAYPMPGQLIDVGGYKMHINCSGQGTPTVIFESALGGSYADWYKVQPQIAQFVRVCSYDRAGVGYSDSSPRPRTSKDIAEELHALLHGAGIQGPIVLVAHSMGGLYVRLYANLYRNEVAGMVLVDVSHPEQEKRLPPAFKALGESYLREFEFIEFTMPFGIPRLRGSCRDYDLIRGNECNFHSLRATVAEFESFSESAAQTAATGSLGDLPLAVLSHDPDKPVPGLPADLDRSFEDAFNQMQEELAHLSTRGTRTIAKNSSHLIPADRPDVVIGAVREIVDQARQAPFLMQSKP